MKGLIFILSCLGSYYAQAQIKEVLSEAEKLVQKNPVSTSDVADGLKEALTNGISKGAALASKVDGYYKNPAIKIPFPPDVKKVEVKLRQIGLGDQIDQFVLTLNRSAEDAALQARPIFIEAIKQMTIDDAWSILKGPPDAATQYLKRTTTVLLKAKFTPVVKNSLDKTNATKYYGEIIHTYNEIPFIKRVNPDLTGYATDLAIQGLFTLIANEEKNIRENPVARTTDLLKRVFGSPH